MRIPSFEVRSERNISLAQCADVPPLMVIAGPNGCGKSTLLNALRNVATDEGKTLYVHPHRNIRRQKVKQSSLVSTNLSFESYMAQFQTPRIEGFNILMEYDPTRGNVSPRDPWGSDETGAYLKPALCQIDMDYGDAVKTRLQRDKEIPRGSIADPWQPIKDMTHNLLPHLAFAEIDMTDRQQVKCLWRAHDQATLVDLDELSSGEKSVIQMFYPLVEHEIKTLVAEIKDDSQPEERPEVCVLIDEPELHLHPNLQVKVLDYLRLLTTQENLQVILATHSPTIVESASFEELFLLRPIELVGSEENQLIQVASDEQRLRFLREVFGTTSNLTAMQPIVVVEGMDERDGKRNASDRKLYRALHPGFDGVTLVPGGGKSECKKLLGVLDDALKDFSPELNAYALLDRDTERESNDNKVHLLPVSMIENFLLDPESIWEAIQSVVERTPFVSADDVAGALDELLTELETQERDRRVKETLGLSYFRPAQPIDHIPSQAARYAFEIQGRFSKPNVEIAIAHAAEKIAELRDGERRREEFHGKAVLNNFYKTHLHRTGMQKNIFTYETARHARRRQLVAEYFDRFFAQLSTPSDVD